MSRGPGRWQRAVLAALADNPDGFLLKSLASEGLGWPLSRSDVSARQRAAKALEARGLCKLLRVWAANRNGIRSPLIAVQPPGSGLPANYALTGYERHVSSGSSAWSDRMVAERLGVAPGTVARVRQGLSVEPGKFGQVQPFGAEAGA